MHPSITITNEHIREIQRQVRGISPLDLKIGQQTPVITLLVQTDVNKQQQETKTKKGKHSLQQQTDRKGKKRHIEETFSETTNKEKKMHLEQNGKRKKMNLQEVSSVNYIFQ